MSTIVDKAEIPPTPGKEAFVENDVEENEVKVEVGTKTAKGKQVIDDLEFIQGPINLASLSPIQRL